MRYGSLVTALCVIFLHLLTACWNIHAFLVGPAFPAESCLSVERRESLPKKRIPSLLPASLDKNQMIQSAGDVVVSKVAPLSLSLDQLADILHGKGRAQAVWGCYRQGVDPLAEYGDDEEEDEEDSGESMKLYNNLGAQARKLLEQNCQSIDSISRLIQQTTSTDGTTKLLLELSDGLRVETVILPWEDRQTSTLCVSSQVGCQQACRFCLTGRMGLLRSLSSDEILAQVFWANRIIRNHCLWQRRQGNHSGADHNHETTIEQHRLFPIDGIVFMGMGEPADNAPAVVQAAHRLTDLFALAPRKITISTVGPTLQAFEDLAQAPAVLAWSVHSSRDDLRRQALVPTQTKHSMQELRDRGLIPALLQRSRRMRSTMLEVTLLQDVNDSVNDAQHLADFCRPLLERVPNIKLVVNLIPWNDISASFGPASRFETPSHHSVLRFQQVLRDSGILCYIRTTRGDDESAACGQLATTSTKHKSGYSSL